MARIILVLEPKTDPLVTRGHTQEERSADYRLKLLLKELLRAYGFKCVEVRETMPEVKT